MYELAGRDFNRPTGCFFGSCSRRLWPKCQNAETAAPSELKSLQSSGQAAIQTFTSWGASPALTSKLDSFNVPLGSDCMFVLHRQIPDCGLGSIAANCKIEQKG